MQPNRRMEFEGGGGLKAREGRTGRLQPQRGGLNGQTGTVCLLIAWIALGCGGAAPDTDTAQNTSAPHVLNGIDAALSDSGGVLRGRRIGLITNHTGRTREGRSTIDALAELPGVNLVALFAPEHGLRGMAEAGELVESGVDPTTGLPIHSLYAETRAPTAAMLEGIDALVFDIQDIGARYYTYVWTMALAMRAAAEHGRTFVVLDRPNPIGGARVDGNVLDTAFASFVGLYPVPMRHGMTAGELATFVNETEQIGADLIVVPLSGWSRSMWYDDTGLPWTATSPNMPSLESAAHYPGTCLFEGTNLSVGRGTSEPFRQLGAPWLDAEALVQRLQSLGLTGVHFDTTTFTPRAPGDGKHDGVSVDGVRLTVTDRATYDPAETAVIILTMIRQLHPGELTFREAHFDRLAGTDQLRLQILDGVPADSIIAAWSGPRAAFEAMRSRYLRY